MNIKVNYLYQCKIALHLLEIETIKFSNLFKTSLRNQNNLLFMTFSILTKITQFNNSKNEERDNKLKRMIMENHMKIIEMNKSNKNKKEKRPKIR
jgi:uncharacterized protein (DUF2225 family)